MGTAGSGRSGAACSAGALRLLFALLLALSLLCQGVALQTHVHHPVPQAAGHADARSADATLSASDQTPDDDAKACPVCKALARYGHYVTPSAVILAGPASTQIFTTVVSLVAWPHRHASHGWYGRGPPLISAAA